MTTLLLALLLTPGCDKAGEDPEAEACPCEDTATGDSATDSGTTGGTTDSGITGETIETGADDTDGFDGPDTDFPPQDDTGLPRDVEGEGTCKLPFEVNFSTGSRRFAHTASGGYDEAIAGASCAGGATGRDLFYRLSFQVAGSLLLFPQGSNGAADPILVRYAEPDCGSDEAECVDAHGAGAGEEMRFSVGDEAVTLISLSEVTDSKSDYLVTFEFTPE